MSPEYRHPYGGCGNFHRIITKDFFRLIYHLDLFFCIAVIHELIDMRETVKRYLMRINNRIYFLETKNIFSLVQQFIHGLFPGA